MIANTYALDGICPSAHTVIPKRLTNGISTVGRGVPLSEAAPILNMFSCNESYTTTILYPAACALSTFAGRKKGSHGSSSSKNGDQGEASISYHVPLFLSGRLRCRVDGSGTRGHESALGKSPQAPGTGTIALKVATVQGSLAGRSADMYVGPAIQEARAV